MWNRREAWLLRALIAHLSCSQNMEGARSKRYHMRSRVGRDGACWPNPGRRAGTVRSKSLVSWREKRDGRVMRTELELSSRTLAQCTQRPRFNPKYNNKYIIGEFLEVN